MVSFIVANTLPVVGGGDTALEEANYLTNMAASVTLIHRAIQEFRASQIMVDRIKAVEEINCLFDSVVDEFLGETKSQYFPSLTNVRVKNVQTGETQDIPVEGCFIAIGHKPNTEIFEGIINLDEEGYIITEGKSTYTNIPGVFACGRRSGSYLSSGNYCCRLSKLCCCN